MPLRFNCRKIWLLPLILLIALPLHPESRGPVALEKRLTKRVDQLYRLFVSGDWEKVTPFISEDTRQNWIATAKGKVNSYHIESVNIAPDGKQARVTVEVVFPFPKLFTTLVTQPQMSDWVYQKGEWFMKMRPRPSLVDLMELAGNPPPNPAGSLPPFALEQNPIKVPLPAPGAESVVRVSFQNVSPLPTTFQNLRTNCPCLKVEVDRPELQTGGKGTLTVTFSGSPDDSSGTPLAIQATILPSMYSLNIPVVVSK